MRICSLLPSATEILYALGLGDSVVGVTHECDYPPEAAKKPPLIRPRVDPRASPAAIDRQVAELVSRGESIYAVDAELLASLAPDLIIAQDLCHVCAASPRGSGYSTYSFFEETQNPFSNAPLACRCVGRHSQNRRGDRPSARCSGVGNYSRAKGCSNRDESCGRSQASRPLSRMDGSVLHRRPLGSRNGREGWRRGRIRMCRRAVVSHDGGANRRHRCGGHCRDAVRIQLAARGR